MVFYFTGTGNSLYIAKQIEASPLSIPQEIQKEKPEFSAESIGIVAPVYGHELPAMVKDFLKKAVFHTDYFYLILTYGNRHGGAAELAQKYCEKCGITPRLYQCYCHGGQLAARLRYGGAETDRQGGREKSGGDPGGSSEQKAVCFSGHRNGPGCPSRKRIRRRATAMSMSP